MQRSLALGLAGAAVVAITAVPGPAAQADPGPAFGPCPDDISKPHPELRCTTVNVPLDYRNSDGEQVQLTVSKLPARKPAARKGSLLLNPGGPGGPGVAFAGRMAKALPAEVLDSYDLIGFDTRNTAHSTPITCTDPATYWKNPLPDPDSAQTRQANWQRAEEYADGCQQRAGKYLPHLSTPNNARDMDRIRQALGEPKISFLGYSYGTYLGAVYGELFGDRVERMILDSSVNPDTSEIWYRDNQSQTVAAQDRLGRYFDWIARYDRTLHLGTDRGQVQAHWDAIRDELRAQPHGKLGPSEFLETSFDTLYGESNWAALAQAMSDFRVYQDDRKLVEQVSVKDEVAENSNAIYTAVECADAPWPTRRSDWERDSTLLAKQHPLGAWYNSWTVAACANWHGPQHEPMKITGAKLPPVLMFNSEHDVATPYEGAQAMHRSLPGSVLVTEENAGKHGVFTLAKNPEADRIGTDYLVRGTTPSEDIGIPAHPLPDPTEPGSEAGRAQG